MAEGIAIKGTWLHEVDMRLEPCGGSHSMRYSPSQMRFSADENGLTLSVPTDLALELYRTGILPQEHVLPVLVRIGDREGWFVVDDLLYANFPNLSRDRIKIKLKRAPRGCDLAKADQPAPTGTYVTDIQHFLDEKGELLSTPGPARKMASFLVLLIEAATAAFPESTDDSGIRCRTRSCRGLIRTSLQSLDDDIVWHCPECGHHGVIRNWRESKWNQARPMTR